MWMMHLVMSGGVGGSGVVSSASVGEIVLDAADVRERVHVLESAACSRFLELHGMPLLVLG